MERLPNNSTESSDRAGEPVFRSIVTALLGPRILSPGYTLLPEEKLALSLSLLLLITSIIILT